MDPLDHAIRIAVEAHAGQMDKAGAPYILHPLRVMLAVSDPVARIAAVLHDVVEDSAWTLERLRQEGFSGVIIGAVDALTRRPKESYEEFVKRAALDPIAREVKIADLRDNLDLSRIARPAGKDLARREKYQRALTMICQDGPESST